MCKGSNDEKVKTEVPITNEGPQRKYVIYDAKPGSEECSKTDSIEYQDPNERALHKIVSNTLKYYQFNDNYSTDVIMKLYSEHDLIKYSKVATNDANPRDLNSTIDMGEYPIVKVFNKKPMVDYHDMENNSVKSESKEKEKKKKYSDLTFLPPRPSKYLDVITYSECSPNFEIRGDQISQEVLDMSHAERQEF